MQNADNQHTHVVQQIDDQVRAVRVKADGWRECRAFAGHAWIFGDQGERGGQALMIVLSLAPPEFPVAVKITAPAAFV